MKTPGFIAVDDEHTRRNFDELRRVFFDMWDGALSRETTATLATGDNEIRPTVSNPKGRVITYQSAAANLFDKGLNAAGNWIINSSAPCSIRLAFF